MGDRFSGVEAAHGGAARATSTAAVPVGVRTATALVLASLTGVFMFCWPLFVRVPASSVGHSSDAPLLFVLVLPFLVAIVLASFAEGGMDSKALAMLGVLSAVIAALRPLGAGIAGVELVFFVLVLAGRVFGPGFGFVLGCTSMFASGLLTAGVGPWLPFQMLAAAWIGLGAGVLPARVRDGHEIAMLVAYGVVAAYLYGFLMNLWFWPYALGGGTDLSFVPGDPLLDNVHRFVVYTVTTSTLGWDTGRAFTNAVAIVVVGPAVLATLRRASRRASFGALPTFHPPTPQQGPESVGESARK